MAMLSELFGEGYTDPRLQMDSVDATTANVLAEMKPGALEQFLSSRDGQLLMVAAGFLGPAARMGGRTMPLRSVQSETASAMPRPRTEAEAAPGGQLPLPLGDANRYPVTAPRAAGDPVPPEVPMANMKAAQEAADAIRALGPEYEPVVMPKGDSVYLRVLRKGEGDPADTGFKGRFADHAQLNWASISADPASGNTAADVVKAFRHHAGIDAAAPEVGWSKMDRNNKQGVAKQRGGLGVYEADFREQGRTSPIRRTVRLFEGAGAAGAGAAAGDMTTEDVARLYNQLRGAR